MGWDDPQASMGDERLNLPIRSTTVQGMIREDACPACAL